LKNILLTTLGRGNLQETKYRFEKSEFETRYCCLALCKILEKQIDLIKVLLTKEAKEKHQNDLQKEATQIGVQVEIIDIPSGKTIDEIWNLFDQLTENFREKQNVNVFLDITNSFRHLPIMAFTSLAYLESKRNLDFSGIYYGAFEAKDKNNVTPVFDISPLLTIVKGAYGVKSFEETGSIIQLKEFLNNILHLEKNNKFKLNKNLEELHGNLASGLSLEAGNSANLIYNWIDKSLPSKNFSFAAQDILTRLKNKIENIKLEKKLNKSKKELTPDELKREFELINWHINNSNTSKAVILLREWIINRIWLTEEPEGNWLNVKSRERNIEVNLGFYTIKCRHNKEFKAKVKNSELFDIWSGLIEARNQFAHAGFQDKNVKVQNIQENLNSFYKICQINLENNEFWLLPKRANNNKKILISPMGASFGLLFTALKLCKPEKVYILTSEKFRNQALEACHKADYLEEKKIKIFTINDPFVGFNETPALINKIWPEIKDSGNIFINLTGGTTAMQWVMQSLYEKIKREQIPVERIAFVDRRPSTEQQKKPWVEGELIEIEKLIKNS
jgi:CRISPR-associated Csx2 family protein